MGDRKCFRCPGCGSEINVSGYCPFCGYAPVAAAIHLSDKLLLTFLFRDNMDVTLSFKIYWDDEPELSEISERNLFERVSEELHFRRVRRIFISAASQEKRDYCCEMVRKFALSPLEIVLTDTFRNSCEFVERVKDHVRTVDELEKVNTDPDDKIGGAHSTVIGGREGLKLLVGLAASPYVKKVVPGVIESAGISGGGVRLKLTRCDDRRNIRALLIDGSSVQQVYVITTAADKKQGERVLKELKSVLSIG